MVVKDPHHNPLGIASKARYLILFGPPIESREYLPANGDVRALNCKQVYTPCRPESLVEHLNALTIQVFNFEQVRLE